jgi:hypothetical protein
MKWCTAKRLHIFLITISVVLAFLALSWTAPVGATTTKAQTIANFKNLVTAHSSVASYQSLGKTLLGNNIWVFKFGNPNGGRVLWTAQLHGGEEMGSEIMWIFAQWLVSNDSKARQYLKTNYVTMVPVVNFDSCYRDNMRRSYILSTGKTISVTYGVNLNRNFPIGWGQYGSPNPCNSGGNYWGISAGSEPETQVLVNAIKTLKPKFHIDFHDWEAPLTPAYGNKTLVLAVNQTQNNYFASVKPKYKGTLLTPYLLKYEVLAPSTFVRESQGLGIGCTSMLVELDPARDPQFRTGIYTACPLWAIQQYYYPKVKGLLLGTLDATAIKT